MITTEPLTLTLTLTLPLTLPLPLSRMMASLVLGEYRRPNCQGSSSTSMPSSLVI